MNLEAPTITNSNYGSYGSNTVNLLSTGIDSHGGLIGAAWIDKIPLETLTERMKRHQQRTPKNVFAGYDEIDTEPPTTTENMSNKKAKRLVQVYVVDPHPDVPLDKSILYSQPTPILTDATDQELFFQIDMKQILHDHNGVRVKTVDKEASKSFNKEVYLEPVRIRDLVMNILTIAQF